MPILDRHFVFSWDRHFVSWITDASEHCMLSLQDKNTSPCSFQRDTCVFFITGPRLLKKISIVDNTSNKYSPQIIMSCLWQYSQHCQSLVFPLCFQSSRSHIKSSFRTVPFPEKAPTLILSRHFEEAAPHLFCILGRLFTVCFWSKLKCCISWQGIPKGSGVSSKHCQTYRKLSSPLSQPFTGEGWAQEKHVVNTDWSAMGCSSARNFCLVLTWLY